ncbi:hypothetical protein PHLGIDRAFT_120685 [Phlebiopsis gigantea 11061_1 CR5-6]|uniref:DUF6534 domain-containing protein n=1 Tax=Phlebiopsis gigantea (strain 11061_1 CR5-6) TaxID=745531 RepID=A0A0C3RU60_PHLG1|nr:hypothetical protein PHLGIDRAFT_120685 [Phlebiopsis gigantea 11061_1 CR5-6]
MSQPALPLQPPPLPKFNDTLGAVLIGGFSAAIFYGVMCVQTYTFFQRFTKEGPFLKYSVWLLWILDTVHMGFVIHPIYYYMVTNYANPLPLLQGLIPWSIPAGVLTSATVDFIVQVCYTYRVWVLSNKNKALTYPLAVMVVGFYVIAMVYGIRALFLPNFVEYTRINWFLYLAFGLDIIADFYIAVVLCYFLYRSRYRLPRKTTSIINVLIIYTVNTGLITSFICLACVITHASMPDNFIFIGIYLNLAGLYENSLMASCVPSFHHAASYLTAHCTHRLNARDWFRSNSTDVVLSLEVTSHARSSTIGGSERPQRMTNPTQSIESGLPTFAVGGETGEYKATI